MLNEHKSPRSELPAGLSNGQDAEERGRNARKIPLFLNLPNIPFL